MTAVHTLPLDELDVLLGGGGHPHGIRSLTDVQLSRQLLMLRELLEVADEAAPAQAAQASLRTNFAALAEIDAVDSVAVHGVLAYPYVGSWAMWCLRRLTHGRRDGADPRDGAETVTHLAHLGAVALSAALEAARPVAVQVAVRGGRVHLPARGAFVVPGTAKDRVVPVEFDGKDGLRIGSGPDAVDLSTDPDAADGAWSMLRAWTPDEPEAALRVLLDDADPYRAAFLPHPADRLSDTDVDMWRSSLSAAWTILRERHPDQAARIAAGLRVLTPLVPPPEGADTSAASRYAPGAIGLNVSPSAVRTAAGLVHEFEHLVLHALSLLVPLVRPDDVGLVYSPWRRDPRPPIGVVFAVHAWLSMVPFWGAETRADPGDGVAALEWARGREMLREGARVLRASGALAAAGERLLATASAVLDQPVPATVPPRTVHLAEDLIVDHALRWRLRHLVPADEVIAVLVERWTAGDAAGDVPGGRLIPAPTPTARDEARVHRALSLAETGYPGPDDADAALVRGDYTLAAQRYAAILRRSPDDLQAWSGLWVAQVRLATADWTVAHPELGPALRATLSARGVDVAPIEVVGWLVRSGVPR